MTSDLWGSSSLQSRNATAGQGNGRDRYAWLLAGADRLGLEEYAVVPSATPARCESFLGSVHVSAKPTC